ncbi:MAG: ATP-binding protein [Planctomycetota bacterium]
MRATSLASRFLVTLLVTGVLPLAAFGWFTLGNVRGLIDAQVVSTFVPRLCADHAQKIEDRLRQIYQTCSVVREIARRALTSAGELAAFEEQIELVPDLLDNYLDLLLLADADGGVAYWQDGHYLDPGTRGQRAARMPTSVATAGWFRRAQRERGASYLPLGDSLYLESCTGARPRDPAAHHLGLAIDVPRPGERPGVLLALIRWPEVQQLLDDTRAALVAAGYPSASVFLVDADGVMRAHTDRARYGQQLEPAPLRRRLLDAPQGEVEFELGDGARALCAFQRLSGGAPAAWTLALSIPHAELFAATNAFARWFLAAIGASLLVLVAWSLAASRAIARPVRQLAAATGRVARGDLDVRVPQVGGVELGELAASFNQMAQELDAGRRRLAIAEREKAWAEMARQVAHEIKNPLTPMRMAAQLLLRARREGDARADAIAERLARTVEAQTQELDRIASDFRHFAGAPLRSVRTEPLDAFLEQVGQQAGALFEARLQLELVPGAGTARVRIDRQEMQRVLVNLLQNALQAAPDGVRVRLASRVEGDRAILTIGDDGPGIAPAARERLFEPYFTTKTSGTGLGLAICRRIVEVHGGVIRLEATGPGGSTFCIELPLAAEDEA